MANLPILFLVALTIIFAGCKERPVSQNETILDGKVDQSDIDTGKKNDPAGFQPVFDEDHPQNAISNRMEKNFALMEQKLAKDSLHLFESAGIELYQPKEMELADGFTGFLNKRTGISLVVLTNPFSMNKTTAQIVSAAVQSDGMGTVFIKPIVISGRDGVFYLTKEQNGNTTIAKYTVAFGDDDFSWIITATFTPGTEKEFGEELLKSILNINVSDKPRLPPGADVPFTIQPNRLALTDGFVDKVVFTLGGVFPVDSLKEPIFQAGKTVVSIKPEDRERVARELVSPAPAFAVDIRSSEIEVEIDGLKGFEFVSVGYDIASDEPLNIYSVILFDGEDVYAMHGWASADNAENYISDFRSLARSFKLKNKD